MIQNRQRRVRVPVKALNAFLVQACKTLGVKPEALTVCLVTNSEMTRWNRAYRGKDKPTDVLSFPVKSKRSGATQTKRPSERRPLQRQMQDRNVAKRLDPYLGDIAIAPEIARRNAQEFGRTFGDEMRILILHGILHLMGYDHETDKGQMERRERRLRRNLGLTGTESLG